MSGEALHHNHLVRRGGLPVGALNGSYGSNVGEGAQALQLLLDGLEDALYGLSTSRGKSTTGKGVMNQAKHTYLFERQLLAAHQLIANSDKGVDEADRERLLYRSVRMLRDLQYHTGRLFEVMIRTVDVVLPGPNGLQIPCKQCDGSVLYEPNYRTSEVLTPEQRAERYAARMKQFLEQKGDISEMVTLDHKTFAALESGKMVEYTELGDGTVRVSAGTAGHLLLATGQAVRSAGQILVMKDGKGRCTLMYVTNASGSYKPDLLAAQTLCGALCTRFGIPQECAIVSKGMPADTQTFKILLKAGGKTKSEIDRAMERLAEQALAMTSADVLHQWGNQVLQKREAGERLNALQLEKLERSKQREKETFEERQNRKAARALEKAQFRSERESFKAAKLLERTEHPKFGRRRGRGRRAAASSPAERVAPTASACAQMDASDDTGDDEVQGPKDDSNHRDDFFPAGMQPPCSDDE